MVVALIAPTEIHNVEIPNTLCELYTCYVNIQNVFFKVYRTFHVTWKCSGVQFVVNDI